MPHPHPILSTPIGGVKVRRPPPARDPDNRHRRATIPSRRRGASGIIRIEVVQIEPLDWLVDTRRGVLRLGMVDPDNQNPASEWLPPRGGVSVRPRSMGVVEPRIEVVVVCSLNTAWAPYNPARWFVRSNRVSGWRSASAHALHNHSPLQLERPFRGVILAKYGLDYEAGYSENLTFPNHSAPKRGQNRQNRALRTNGPGFLTPLCLFRMEGKIVTFAPKVTMVLTLPIRTVSPCKIGGLRNDVYLKQA